MDLSSAYDTMNTVLIEIFVHILRRRKIRVCLSEFAVRVWRSNLDMTSPVDVAGDKHEETMDTRRYQREQKLFAFGDTFKIKDEMDLHVFQCSLRCLDAGR